MAEKQTSTLRGRLLDLSDIPLRLALAATFIVHGSGKLFGGIDGMAGFLTKLGVPMPGLMAWVVAFAEFGGGVLLALGLATRLAALGHVCVMAVAISQIHWAQGFKSQVVNGQAVGYEWQLALLCMALCLVMRGAGPLSLDRVLGRRRHKPQP